MTWVLGLDATGIIYSLPNPVVQYCHLQINIRCFHLELHIMGQAPVVQLSCYLGPVSI